MVGAHPWLKLVDADSWLLVGIFVAFQWVVVVVIARHCCCGTLWLCFSLPHNVVVMTVMVVAVVCVRVRVCVCDPSGLMSLLESLLLSGCRPASTIAN